MVLLQPQFDDGLREILESIEEKYHAGICMDHPENECFHHCPTNQHFLLDHTKRIVWAAQINAGKALLLSPPLGSTHFSTKKATKVNSTPAATTSTPVSTPVPPATPPNPQTPTAPGFGTPYPPPFAYPHPYPYPSPVAPFHGYHLAPGFFNPSAYPAPWGGGLASGDCSAQDPQSSLPPNGGLLEDFCSQYNLGEET
ncbi:hypothetical protein L208DRAFT_1299659 [Tricholoma matsutake]|nr:hypothetical protein L208DRAFT_1299659 [Tricholoma matsutake 945]